MIPIVCYSNTDYTDILTVQDTFLQGFEGHKVLMVNKVPTIPLHFDRIVTYDDRLSYSKRVLQGLQQIDSDYVLFYHDMDILLRYSPNDVSELVQFMRDSNIDRVDLQHSALHGETMKWKDITLTRSTSYVYNVNPSVWKREVLLDIMTRFDKSYRMIEDMETQTYCARFNIFKIWSSRRIHAGYFHTTPFFIYLHVTHDGKLVPPESNNMEHWIQVVYRGILTSFSFQREIRRTLH
jgi:hypothetical protein